MPVGMCVMPAVVRKFSETRPDTDIYSYVNNTRTIEEMLLRSELDAAVVEGKIRNPDLLRFHLMDDYVALFCAKDHPFAGKKGRLTLGDGASFAEISTTSGCLFFD